MLDHRLLGLWGAAFVSTVAIGCAPAPLTFPAPKAAATMTANVTSALASTQSQMKLGVTRWHSTVEKRSDGTKAGTVDGQDSTGKVVFLAVIRQDSSTVHIQAVLPHKGEAVFSTKKRAIISNTLPSSNDALAAAFETDWQTAYPNAALLASSATTTTSAGSATTTTTTSGNAHSMARGNTRPTPSSSSSMVNVGGIDGNDSMADGINSGLIALGHYEGFISDSKYDAWMTPDSYNPNDYDANGKRIDQSAQDKAQDTQQDKEDQQAADDKAQDTQQDTQDQQAAEDQAQDTQQDNQDQAAEDKAQDTQQDLDDMGSSNQGAQDNPYGDIGDFGGSEQGSDFGGGGFDEGLTGGSLKPDAKAAPSNRCTKTATSKATGVRACVQFAGR